MDKATKKRIKRYLTWAGIAALVALLTVMPLLAKREAQADGPTASVLSAQVTRGDIPQALHGGGTLEALGEQEVNLPTGVKITQFLVKNGDTVQAGDPVALVDPVSVMAAITDTWDTMEYLREELEDARDEKVDGTLCATAGGRVKRIFALPGEAVQDVMLRHGCLALLSIDGLMAVKLEVSSPVTTGEQVTVRLGSGSEIPGRVESNLSGEVIVTIEDEGYCAGDPVTVTLSDGATLGKGSLYIHNAWKVTAYSGTVSTISIREEQVLSAGAAMLTLTDRDYEGELRLRASQHREYEELLQRLLSMYESGVITAPCTGTVSGVDEDSPYLLCAGAEDAQVTPLVSAGSARVVLLSSAVCTGEDDCPYTVAGSHNPGCLNGCCNSDACKAPSGKHTPNCIQGCTMNDQCPNAAGFHKSGCYMLCTETDDPSKCPNPAGGNHKDNCILKCTSEKTEGVCQGGTRHYLSCIQSCKPAATADQQCPATGVHKDSCIRSCVRADVTGFCRTGPHYIDCIESCTPTEATCPATKHQAGCSLYGMTFTAKVAKVASVGSSEMVVYWDASGTDYPVEKTGSGWVITSGQFSETLLVTQGTLSLANAQQQFQKGDILLSITGHKGGSTTAIGPVLYRRSTAGTLPGGGWNFDFNFDFSLPAMVGGFAGYGNYGGTAQPEGETLHDLNGSTLMTVTAEEGLRVSISLDERDIARAQVGLEATVKVEALRGQSFPGTVTKVAARGDNLGYTGKFQVQVELDSIPQSIPGMSSMVTLHLPPREDVLMLPVAALHQDRDKTIVYTALDSKTGKPTSPREVTTGVSDGQFAEIIGLEEGTKVYYEYYDVLEIDTSAKERQFNLN